MAKIIIGKIFGIIFITLAYWLLMVLSFSGQSLFDSIIQAWLGYFIAYFGVVFLCSEIIEKNKILSFIFSKILITPIIGLIYFQYLIAPILTIIVFLAIYFLPSMCILKLGETYPILEQYSQGSIYFLSLVSVLFFAYKSNIAMSFIIETFKTKLFRKYLNKYTNVSFTRMFTYMIMIAIYILYNFLTFSNIKLNFIPYEMLNVIKEVFVTFVAIDSLMQIYLSKQQDNQKKKYEG